MRLLITGFFILFTVFLSDAQNLQAYSEKAGQVVLLGKGDRSGMEMPPFEEWFTVQYEGYQPDQATIRALKEKVKDIRIVIIMGTWCSDSRREVPRFFKVLDELGVGEKQVTLYYVERDITCPDYNTEKAGIERVPTFIFYHKDRELGRIVETPVETLEKDMYGIMKK